jgi:nucleoside-diphosphate-sugar epimerase
MNSKIYSIIYDLFTILFVNVIFVNLVSLASLFTILIFNISLILFLVLIKFYSKSSTLKIFDKLKILILVGFILSIIKLLFFGSQIYYELIIFQDLLLVFMLVLPRILLNIKEFKVNFIKNYNQSRQGTLVIGGLGYIGSGVVLDLLNKGSKVSVLDCCMYGDDVLKKFSKFSNFNFIKGYASDVILLGKLLKENSKVVHLAGLVGDPACALSEKDTRYFNIKTTNIIKDLCFEYEIQRLIFASSCSVYGKTHELCYENSSTNPVSLYAQTKLDSEKELMESKIDTKILRFSTIFGPAERLRFDLVVNLFIAQAYYDKKITVFGGDQERPFLHVKDASHSILNFLNYKITNTQDIYNVGCDELNGTINEIAKLIEKNIQGSSIMLSSENVDARNYAVSFKKYKNLFPNDKFSTIEDSINQFNEIFKQKEIKFRDNVYSNLLTTKTFISDNKNELKNINNFLYE